MNDFRQRFVFDKLDVRGCIVRLEETSSAIQSTHHYPPALGKLLNEFALAACLLRDSIKFDGSLTIQLRTQGAINLIMADCMADRRVRAIAEYEAESLDAGSQIRLDDLGQGATLAITITPEEGERYQSIVPIENASLSACLQDYFGRSEQLPSLFHLLASDQQAVGIALHALPPEKVKNKAEAEEHFSRLESLLTTLGVDEALPLDAQTTLTRLFHEEHCRLFDAHKVEFGCVCSAEKSLDAIAALGKDEVFNIVNEQEAEGKSEVVVDCHFCFQRYSFDIQQIKNLYQ